MVEADSGIGTRAAHAIPILGNLPHQARRAWLAHLEPRFPHPVARVISMAVCQEFSTAAVIVGTVRDGLGGNVME